MVYHLVSSATQKANVDASAPIPIFLDVENWPPDISWTDWVLSQASFSDTPLEDITSGKCAIYAYGMDRTWFKSHPLKDTFEFPLGYWEPALLAFLS